MNETRKTDIVDEEIEEFEQEELSQEETPEDIRDEFFEKVKNDLLNEDQVRVLKKFYTHADQHTEYDFDDMGLDFEESDEILRRCHTLKDKIIEHLESSLEVTFKDTAIDTLHMMIISHTKYKDQNLKMIIEVFEDSFDLEIKV